MTEALNLAMLKVAAREFLTTLATTTLPQLYGVTDGKRVGTYVEQAFHTFLSSRYVHTPGSAASGIDLPTLEVDLKCTSIRQPQSSSTFKSADQKVYGLGYHLLIFVYDKMDDPQTHSARLDFLHAIFVDKARTGDYQTTYGLREILRRGGNKDDLVAFLEERHLPLDEMGRDLLAQRILQEPPELGCLTISNALQWRLQYSRAINLATQERIPGIEDILG